MTKRFSISVLLAALIFAAPMGIRAITTDSFAISQIDDEQQIEISVSQQSVRVTGAQGQLLEVISLTGRRVMAVRIESPAQRVELNNIPKGCYIIKIGKVVRKIVI